MAGVKGRSGGRRENAGNRAGTSTGPRPMAGPKPKHFTVALGDQFYVGLQNGGLWTVTALDKTHLTFTDQQGHEITLVR